MYELDQRKSQSEARGTSGVGGQRSLLQIEHTKVELHCYLTTPRFCGIEATDIAT